MAKLTEKQRQFAAEYLKDFNATQAAIRAGYSARTAGPAAGRLLKKVQIQEILANHRAAAASAAIMGFEEACSRLSAIGRAQVADYVDEDGHIDWQALRAVNPQAVASVEHEERGPRVTLRKFKLHNPVPAIERLARMQGWDAPVKQDVQGNITTTILTPEGLDAPEDSDGDQHHD